jgi:alpha-amylase/alpha-mannosidase (GH57 family)
MIMPLANANDKQTQVIWGIKDFEYRFKRKPEGMWLPETAVDVSTLEVLAEHGIIFTILAPNQAQAVAKIGTNDWTDVKAGSIDAQLPYLCRLPSGKKIVIFFYNGPVSNDIAFGNLLENGVNFANRLVQQFPKRSRAASRLVHVANDGETFGHHHAFGNMALAYMFYHIETNNLAKITVYGEFLANNPPEWEVKIIDDTSWSCFHGVERWRANCGCYLDNHKEHKQEWRKYLRKTLDWLRDKLIPLYEKKMSAFYDDPWKIRNDYIDAVLDPSEENKSKVLWAKSPKGLSAADRENILNLLEMQRNAMYMYTSCGWFFDDISGIESVQILHYAGRAMQLAKKISGNDLEAEFLNRLSSAKSNYPEMKDGKRIYNTFIKSAMVAAARKNNV